LDAPISGSSEQTRRGEVTVIVGGPREAFDACRDLFECCAAKTIYAGRSGSGAKMKLVSNLVLGLNRAALAEENIGTSVHFIPLHLHPYYRRRWNYRPADHPVATAEFERVMSLPIWPGMTDEHVGRVVDSLVSILEGARRA